MGVSASAHSEKEFQKQLVARTSARLDRRWPPRPPWQKERCQAVLDRFVQGALHDAESLQAFLAVFTSRLPVRLKGGGAYAALVFGEQSVPALLAKPVVRDVDLELSRPLPLATVFAELRSAVEVLNGELAPRLRELRLPAGVRVVDGPAVSTTSFGDQAWLPGGRRGPLAAVYRGHFHGNSQDFTLFRVALTVMDEWLRVTHLPFVDLVQVVATGSRSTPVWTAHEVQCDLYRMLTQEALLRPWLSFDSKAAKRLRRFLALALLRDERRGRSLTAYLEAAAIEHWLMHPWSDG